MTSEGQEMSHLPPTRLLSSLQDVDFSRLAMPLLVAYDHPQDFPNEYVLRVFDLARPTNCAMAFDTVEALRAAIPAGFVRLARGAQDDPAILEVYV